MWHSSSSSLLYLLVVLLQKCPDYLASPIPTFARTEPPDTQVTKSIISLLNYYGWKKFSIIYDQTWEIVAKSLSLQAARLNMTINHSKEVQDSHVCCSTADMDCCQTGYWYETIRTTMKRTRIYVFLGPVYSLSLFMDAMDSLSLFRNGEYMVIFVDMDIFSPRDAHKCITPPDKLVAHQSCYEQDNFLQRARSLLVIVASPPAENYENFTVKVREYNKLEPFKFQTPDFFTTFNYVKFVSIYAAYLYDSVMLYAFALDKMLRVAALNQTLTEEVIRYVSSQGAEIVETIIQKKIYQSE